MKRWMLAAALLSGCFAHTQSKGAANPPIPTGVMIGLGVMLAVTFGFLIVGMAFGASGRPFRVRGRARLAGIERSSSPPAPRAEGTWSPHISVADVEPKTRARLAEIWTADARFEHASIATFSRLSLQLLALGAPSELVSGAAHAATQEVEHARLCFALASAYARQQIAPGAFPDAIHPAELCLDTIACESIVDGCLGEAIAAESARQGSLIAPDPEVAAVLALQARDEAEHAALAWKIVDWCLAREPRLTTVLEHALMRATMPTFESVPEHGRIGGLALASRYEELRQAALTRVRQRTGSVQDEPWPGLSSTVTSSVRA